MKVSSGLLKFKWPSYLALVPPPPPPTLHPSGSKMLNWVIIHLYSDHHFLSNYHFYYWVSCGLIILGCKYHATDSPSSQTAVFNGDDPARGTSPGWYQVLLHGDIGWQSYGQSWYGSCSIPCEQTPYVKSTWTGKGAPRFFYHLQKLFGKFGWKVNGTRLFGSFRRKISGSNGT